MSNSISSRIWVARAGRVSGPYDKADLLTADGTIALGNDVQIRFEGDQRWISSGEWKARLAREHSDLKALVT